MTTSRRFLHTTDRHIAVTEDTAKALDYKRAGLTIRQIAAQIGRTPAWVNGAIQTYVDSHPTPHLQAFRTEVLERQAGIIAAHWATRQNPQSAKVIQDADRIIIQITGIEAKKEVDVSGAVILSDGAHVQLISHLAGLAAKLGAGESDPGSEPDSGSGSPVQLAPFLGPT